GLPLTRLSFSWMKETLRRTKQCTGKLPVFGAEKSGIARDPASRHPVRWAGGVLGVSAACWLSRSREQVSAVSSYFPQRHRSGGDLHRFLTLGGGRSAALRRLEFVACRRGLARRSGDLALSCR